MAASPGRSLCPTRWTRKAFSAQYDKGVLKIKLAKKAEAKPKQIKISVGSEKTLARQGPGGVSLLGQKLQWGGGRPPPIFVTGRGERREGQRTFSLRKNT